ncbi:MAG: HAD family hydrolase [Oscillospiraceae bacterium]|nr:HAD family hydrolase [Ruminococcus sp.]MCD8346064.1 HAD family hydrolase [Oscillospiraceae bacterium]
MYKTCIFDFYGTLCDIRTDERKPELWEKLALFYGFYGASYTPEELMNSYFETVSELESRFSEIKIEQVFGSLFERKGVQADETLAVHAGQFFRILSIEHLRLYDGVKEMLESLHENGRKIYLLSNAQRIFTEFELKYLGIWFSFDDIFISSDHNCKKPDSDFYQKLIDKQNIDVSSAIMVGNDGTCDIAGAKDVGLHTLYIKSDISPDEPIPKADHVLMKPDMAAVGDELLKEGA